MQWTWSNRNKSVSHYSGLRRIIFFCQLGHETTFLKWNHLKPLETTVACGVLHCGNAVMYLLTVRPDTGHIMRFCTDLRSRLCGLVLADGYWTYIVLHLLYMHDPILTGHKYPRRWHVQYGPTLTDIGSVCLWRWRRFSLARVPTETGRGGSFHRSILGGGRWLCARGIPRLQEASHLLVSASRYEIGVLHASGSFLNYWMFVHWFINK